MIVFLGCSKTKNNYPCAAKEMYQGLLFKKSLQYARSLNPDKIFILSAKYGLLELDDLIIPYEKTLNHCSEHEKKKWAYKVYLELQKRDLFKNEAIFLCGENYRKYLMRFFRKSNCPTRNMTFGKSLAFYTREIQRRMHEANE